jgi:hypothetical protein
MPREAIVPAVEFRRVKRTSQVTFCDRLGSAVQTTSS